MPRAGSTADRGYAQAHRNRVRQLKAALVDGTPCARGGEPLYRWQLQLPARDPRSLDGDHVTRPSCFGGGVDNLPTALSCAHHNRQHGARLGNQLRRANRYVVSPPEVLPEW